MALNEELRKVWPALESTFDHGRAEIRCWGREYRLKGALPDQIVSGGENVLAAPARFVAKFHGKEEPFGDFDGFLTGQDEEKLTYQCMQTAGNIMLNARVRVEFDGFVWVDLLLIPFGMNGPVTHSKAEVEPCLEALYVDFPIRRDLAELYHFWPGVKGRFNSGAVPADGMHLPFKPHLWIGREEAGLSLYAESDENRQFADPNDALTVEWTEDAAVLRMHLVDSLPQTWAKPDMDHPFGPIRFSFGYQATPVRAFKRDEDLVNWVHIGSKPLDEFRNQADTLKECGAKWCSYHNWDKIQNYGLPEDEDLFRAQLKVLHERGMRCIVYFGFEYATCAPTFFDDFEKCLVRDPWGSFRGGWQRYPAQRDYKVCYQSSYAETMLAGCRRAMDEYGADGIYTDGTYVPSGCANEAHGCGYTDRDGIRHETYPLLNRREHVKKLFIQTHERGGLVEAHQSGCAMPMLIAFCDTYWDGEHLAETWDPVAGKMTNMTGPELMKYFLESDEKLMAFRAEFSGVNFGVPCQFLFYSKTYGETVALPLLFGTPFKPCGVLTTAEEAGYHWKVRSDYGLADAPFTPFWHKDCPVKAEDPAVRCSVWETGRGVMIVAANLTGEPVTTAFCTDLPYSRVLDVKTGDVPADGRIEVAPYRAAYVFLEK